MKINLLRCFKLFALAGCLLAFAGCDNDDDDGQPTPPAPDVEETLGIGTYSFRGEPNKIVSGVAFLEGDYLTCIFSPENLEEGKADTYFMFSLHTYWEGQVVDASTLYHNDQYVFIYEDPIYYYSQYKSVTGTLYMKRNSGDKSVTVKLNLRLYNGVRFKAEATVDLTEPSLYTEKREIIRKE